MTELSRSKLTKENILKYGILYFIISVAIVFWFLFLYGIGLIILSRDFFYYIDVVLFSFLIALLFTFISKGVHHNIKISLEEKKQ